MLPLKSSLPRFRITSIGYVILCLPLLLVMYALFRDPDASFRSSDSNWARSENSFKGYGFEGIAFNFEAYRLKCQADYAELVRTTTMHWWNIFAWPSYMTNPKWNVPYGKPDLRIGPTFPRALTHHCATSGLKYDEIALIKERSRALVQSFDGA